MGDDDGIPLHLGDGHGLFQPVLLIHEPDYRLSAVVGLVGRDDEVMCVGGEGAGVGLRNPVYGRHLYLVCIIAFQFHLDGLAFAAHEVFLLGQDKDGAATGLVNGHFLREAVASVQGDDALAGLQVFVGCGVEAQGRGGKGAGVGGGGKP